jgi:hypothetical protein
MTTMLASPSGGVGSSNCLSRYPTADALTRPPKTLASETTHSPSTDVESRHTLLLLDEESATLGIRAPS